jgi:hypothetical protein
MKFKHLTFLALTLALGSCGTIAQKSKPLFPQMPGMVSYTYRASFAKDAAATLDTLKELGIKDIEFSNLLEQQPLNCVNY